MLEMHSREEGSAAIRPSTTFALLYFFFFVIFYSFFSPLFDALRVRIFFVERQADANRNCTLDILAIGTGFEIFVQVHIRTRCKLANGALVIDTFYY